MLKRRRAPSPPPSSSSNVPLIADSTSLENTIDRKRRRVQPPVLDGQMRGWGTPQDVLYESLNDREDDGEEDFMDDDEPYLASGSLHNDAPNSPYKSANGFLHELHTLQRHRLSFSSNTPIRSPNSYDPAYDYSPQSHPHSRHFSSPEKCLPAPISTTQVHAADPQETFAARPYASDFGTQHELNLVKGHYEEKNRLLGSVVLSRRRELEHRPDNDT